MSKPASENRTAVPSGGHLPPPAPGTLRLLYRACFPVAFGLSWPYYALRMWRRGNWRSGFAQRFGHYDAGVQISIGSAPVLWVHAVSVGEMNVCVALVRALQPRLPGFKIIVSTTTTTGMGVLQQKLPSEIEKIYYPIDHHKWVTRAFQTLRPRAMILMESEIWPNFIWQAGAARIPLFLVNARVSDRSYPRYRRLGFLFRGLFGAFTGVGAQSEENATRLREVGCPPEAIRMLGNLKFDTVDVRNSLDVPGLLAQLGVEKSELLVAGSTHDGEEEILAALYRRLRRQFPRLFLVLVPRHFERARPIARGLGKHGLRVFCRSEIASSTHLAPGSLDCLLVDTTGELLSFYRHGTVCFVGKSLTSKGGQNPIEPAALGKPTVFGPNMQNFRDVARILVSGGGAIQVADAAELEQSLVGLLADPARRELLGTTAQKIVRANQGAVARTVDMIVEPLNALGRNASFPSTI